MWRYQGEIMVPGVFCLYWLVFFAHLSFLDALIGETISAYE